MGSINGPLPDPLAASCGSCVSTLLHRHRCTASKHRMTTTLGGSNTKSRTSPTSVISFVAEEMVHCSLVQVMTKAAPGP